MTKVELSKDKPNLSDLLELAISGEEVLITKNDRPVAKISPIENRHPLKFGSAKNKVSIAENFDETLQDFQEYI